MKQLIWDVPTRLFHAAFAVSILAAFALGKFASEHSELFVLHMFFGAMAGVLLVWRLIRGLAGSKHERFSALLFSPARTIEYFLSVLKGRGQYFAGHNPGGALFVWAALILAGVSIASGLSMGFLGETFEEVHEVSTVLLIAAVCVHVCGVVIASLMHQESYAMSMITGRKTADASNAIESARPIAGVLFAAALTLIGIYLFRGLDLKTAAFTAPGTSFSLQFGENESESESEQGAGEKDGGAEGEEEEEDDED